MRAGSGSGTRRPLRTCGEVSPARAAPLAWVAQLETLEEVLHRGLPIEDVIVQDEYTHDIVTRAGELYVVFDST
jgi:predicted HTH domain antitoxin